MARHRYRHIAALAAAALTLSACGGSDSDTSADPSTASSASQTKTDPDSTESTSSSSSSDSSDEDRNSGKTETSTSSSDNEDSQGQGESTNSTTQGTDSRDTASDAKLHDVVRVVDGDTVKVAINGGESVRVIGIDTPETVHPSVPDECGGAEASQAAKDLLTGQQVRVVFDPSQGKRDKYDRVLAYLEIPGTGDFGEIMLRQGHAAEYTYDTAYARQSTYRAAERQADGAGKGLWGACGGPDVPAKAAEPAPTPEPTPTPTSTPAPSQPGSAGGGASNPASAANAPPGSGWTNDTLTPGYTGCRTGYPGGRINGVYWWKPRSC